MNTPIKRALISVSDKTNLIPFAQFLESMGVEILSTGGTARELRKADIEVIDVSDYTGFPEILDGRVKTLHPKVHGGLLFLRNNPKHVEVANVHGILPIDLVVVNLYPFEATVAKPGVAHEEVIENIDIGGPSMIRSAAKNYQSVTVIVDPADYDKVCTEMTDKGFTTLELRERLALKVFSVTEKYDDVISNYLHKRVRDGMNPTFTRDLAGPNINPPSGGDWGDDHKRSSHE